MSVYVVRAFVQLRELLASNAERAGKLNELECTLALRHQSLRSMYLGPREPAS